MLDSISKQRSEYSSKRLKDLKTRLNDLDELKDFPKLTVFGAGSYARLEASEFSDIDMFFLSAAKKGEDLERRKNSFRMFGKVIDTIDAMEFPEFSNDCEFLVVINTEDILSNLGSRSDDHENYFTARMLLLLESHCLYGDEVFADVTSKIVSSYFKDFPKHQQTFQPMFLLNDIGRYWKTLLLNYENKRNISEDKSSSEGQETKQKVRNFKLKYSRMTTCFASMAAFGSYSTPVDENMVIGITKLTPRARLESVAKRIPKVKKEVSDVLEQYEWFLEMTGLETSELEGHFADKQKRMQMFKRANEYGDTMYKLIQAIDETDPEIKLIRYLVI